MAMATSAAAASASLLPSASSLLPHRPVLPHLTSCAPLRVPSNGSRFVMSSAPTKKLDLCGPTSLALLAAAVIPEIAEAAQPGISPSLKNLLLSVVAGGVVLVVLSGAVAAVSTFDPVKRR